MNHIPQTPYILPTCGTAPKKGLQCNMTETMESRSVAANVKDWLQNKCRDASSLKSVDHPPMHPGRQLTYGNLAITPHNTPKFIIPSSMEPARNGSVPLLDTDLQSQSSSGGSMTSASGLPGSYAGPRHVWGQQPTLRSAPSWPSSFYEESSSGSNSSRTNSDPMSLAALSLPHLKKQTLYGFETLTETPRTCRRESLFHDGLSRVKRSQGLPLTRRTYKRDKSSSQETSIPQIQIEDVDRGTSRRQYHKQQHNRTTVIAPLGNILSKKLPVPSSQSSSCQGHREDNVRELGYSPRCGSHATDNCCNCPDNNKNATRHSQHSISSSEHQQHQHQDNLQRASLTGQDLYCRNCLISSPSPLQGLSTLQTNQENPNMLKKPSTGSSSGDFSSCSTCQSFSQSSEGGSSSSSSSSKGQHIGHVRLTLLYLPKQRQLKVGLIQVKDLTSSNTETPSNNMLKHSPINSPPTKQNAQQLNPFVKLCLMPGKVQRHVSKVVHHTQNPVFNQDFIFNHIEPYNVAKRSLRLKVYHKKAKLGREVLLGELTVSMAELIPSKMVTLLRELEPVSSGHKLGYIHISACFHPSTEKLTVSVHQVTDLTRQTFTGAPDPYVRVELSQLRRSSTRQQTKTKKNTDHVFNETFTFGISPKLEDLHYTCVTVTVLDHLTLLADKEIGQVCLGFDATEEAEFHHWNQVLQRPGHPATSWHVLMHPYSD